MHDLFEGVCRYAICDILLHFIYILEERRVSLGNFNYKNKMFHFVETEIVNMSLDFELHQLKNTSIKTSASEIKSLMIKYSLIIGDLIPVDNIVQKYTINLIKIIDILLKSEFDEDSNNNLSVLIQRHNEKHVN